MSGEKLTGQTRVPEDCYNCGNRNCVHWFTLEINGRRRVVFKCGICNHARSLNDDQS